ncbi:cytochrome P450 monooxygenase 16 [Heterobasidion irregulare TC 32-1]|uniref:Cytochrome P450 monooxygenase 16 n=1 Tax=Heterobasidion irregulare (strain TC 32-1) TaxID=747525 RepID=W4JV14_HETIT|nr:cytochrome P450 monooxygenase 16 [Heterobasidion irregulare TC 32-1]ETW76925.1 cytochrome P450 monooxygenase 16 [Heterobasidion irregulare TC 32-1]
MSTLWLTVAVLLVSLLPHLWYQRKGKHPYSSLPFPPGPKRLPFIGNLFNLPRGHDASVYRDWSREFGSEIVHLDVIGMHAIVVNSARAAREIFEKRSLLYSDRPSFLVLNKMLGFRWALGFMPYGRKWRNARKAFHSCFNSTASLRYHRLELQASQELLRRLLDTPQAFVEHVRHMAVDLILEITYGSNMRSMGDTGDDYVIIAEKTLDAMLIGSTPHAVLLDSFPILSRLPAWFPGAGIKREATRWRPFVEAMMDVPYRKMKETVRDGTAPPSVASSMAFELESKGVPEDIIKQTTASMYLGGVDTTVSALSSFFLAMVLYPEAQDKAQKEIDTVVGNERLPEFSGEASLPYVGALVKEVLRWRPVLPLAIPHRASSDDEYEGYYIPAGSLVIGNTWAIMHDESVFPDPDCFDPGHFLGANDTSPDFAFGFGRRVCPGRFMAYSLLWAMIASVLATFTISKAVDEDGNEIEVSDDYTEGMATFPLPFECRIEPRSLAAASLVRSTVL